MIDLSDGLLLVARIFLSSVFLFSGVEKLLWWREGVDELEGLRAPFPTISLALTVCVQIAAGAMVLMGVYSSAGALVLFGFTCAATLMGHPFWTLRGIAFRRTFTIALEHLAIMGGFLLIAATGPGRLTLSAF